MSRGVLINTVDTYIGTALYEEFLGENPSESAIYARKNGLLYIRFT